MAVPLEPDRGEARQWAEQELARPEYQDAQPSLLERVMEQINEWLGKIEGPDGPGNAILLTVVLLVVAALIGLAVYRVGSFTSAARRRESAGVLAETRQSAGELRASAEAAAARGDWLAAELDRFRAIARTLEERAVLTPRPSRTADEVAAEAGAWLPELDADLRLGAVRFDDLRYGDRPAGQAGYQRLAELDRAVQRARPRDTPLPRGPHLAVPA